MLSRIFKWFIFTVFLSLMPLGISGVILHDHEQLVRINDVWSRGELLLLSFVCTSIGLGDLLFVSARKYNLRKMSLCGLVIFLIVINIIWYVELTSDKLLTLSSVPSSLQATVLNYSPYAFLCSLLVGLACVMLPPDSTEPPTSTR
jgi:hypothetical protein